MKWQIKTNKAISVHVTLTLKKYICAPVTLNTIHIGRILRWGKAHFHGTGTTKSVKYIG